jgi:hypothetical protein
MTRLNITVDRPTKGHLLALSRLTGASDSESIRRAIALYLQEWRRVESGGISPSLSEMVAALKTQERP